MSVLKSRILPFYQRFTVTHNTKIEIEQIILMFTDHQFAAKKNAHTLHIVMPV